MARKNIQINSESSPDEERLASLKSSIASSENELVENGNVNKKVLAEIEENKKYLADSQVAKDSLNTEISSIKDEKDQNLKGLSFTKEALAEITAKKKEAEKDLTDFRVFSELKKNELQSQIKSLEDKIEAKKQEVLHSDKLSIMEKEKISNEIFKLNSSLAGLLKREADQKEKNDSLVTVCAESSIKKDLIEEDFSKIKAEVFRQEEVIRGLEAKVARLTGEIDQSKLEIKKLDDSIVAKKEEYKAQETKLFAIKDKEFALDQRERFIKDKYERAGVKWE